MLRSVLALSALLLVSALAGCAGAGALPADEAALLREDLESAYAEIERLRQRNDDLEFRVRQAMECEAQAARNGERGTTVAVLPTDIFFESGSAELTAQGAARLSEVASRLRSEFPGREIRIEGSTDSMPIGPTLRTSVPLELGALGGKGGDRSPAAPAGPRVRGADGSRWSGSGSTTRRAPTPRRRAGSRTGASASP
jgi:hypothetical protein